MSRFSNGAPYANPYLFGSEAPKLASIPYPHIPADQWTADGATVPIPSDWYLTGRRIILENGCKITVGAPWSQWQCHRYPITVDEGRLPDDAPYLLKVVAFRDGAAEVTITHEGGNRWELSLI